MEKLKFSLDYGAYYLPSHSVWLPFYLWFYSPLMKGSGIINLLEKVYFQFL